ncbi:MAG: M56 family metallopeptidase [Planctomycetota bacterium]
MQVESVMAGALMTAGANVLIQVTCVLSAGWLLERIATRRGPEAVAWVQRATLVSVLLIPAAAIAMHSLMPRSGVYVSLPEPAAMGGPLSAVGLVYLLLSMIWFAGTVWGLMRLALGMRKAKALVDSSLPADGFWTDRAKQLARQEGLPPERIDVLDVRISDQVGGPCLVGMRRPALILPAANLHACNDLVLLHELTHLRRSDNFWGVVTSAVRSSVWVHPLAWRLRRAHHVASEHACDDAVLASRPNAVEYVRSLVSFSNAGPLVPAAVPAASLFGKRGELLERSRRLLSQTDGHVEKARARGFATLPATALILGGVVLASTLFAVHHTSTAALAGWALLWCAMP